MKDWRIGALGVTLALTLLLSGANIYMHQRNLSLQTEVNARQQRINEGVRLSQFNTQLVQVLARMAAATADAAIEELLKNHGITYTVNAPADGGVGGGQP